jgi:tetratricopeptide (TPR) repeat protein
VDGPSSSGDDPVTPAEMPSSPAERSAQRLRSAEGAFVGRDRELGEGLASLEDALAGQGRLLLLAGEPGIGKSRLADELAARAKERGVQVVWGRCWEAGGAPAYWPWVQSLRSLIRNLNAEELQAQMGSGAVDLAQMLPEIRDTLNDLPVAPTLDPDAARFRLFDAVMTYLKNVASVQPLMVVLDDLQVADSSSLLLLRFVAEGLGDDRILVLGTYRDTELIGGHPLSSTVTELARGQAFRRLALRGLAEAVVPRFIEAITGVTPQDSLVRAVHGETEGNPLFLEEVARMLQEEGRLERGLSEPAARVVIPRSVREVIGRRLRPLSSDCLHILTFASVLGREFSLHALSRLVERPVDDVRASLEEPIAARVVTDVSGSIDRLRFAHVVIRESLYDEIPRARRLQLHRLAAHVLEGLYGQDIEPHLAELAHHFFEGATEGHTEQATGYTCRAAEQAVSLLAYEEAVRLYRMALQGLELGQTNDPMARCELLLALGDAQTRAADEAGAKETFLHAAGLSRSLNLGEQLARAALGYGGRFVWGRAGGDSHVIPLLEEGLAAIGEGDSELRARILARLAGALRDDRSSEPRESLGKQAVDLARRLGDPATLAYALEGLYAAMWRPDNAQERLTIASETVAVGGRAGDRERVLAAHQHVLFVFLELGDMPSVYRELDAIDRLTEELRQPAQSWAPASMRAMLALFEGRFGDAETWVSAAFRLRARTSRSDALLSQALQLFQLRRAQGRLAEVAELVHHAAQQLTWYPVLRCALAVLNCELGRETQARTEFEAIAAGDFAGLPFDNKWVFSMSLLSEVAYFLGDHRRAKILCERLLPYAETNGLAAGDGCTGSVSRCLGLLASVMSLSDEAVHRFEDALDKNERMGARPWVAHTQYDLAMVLMARDGAGDVNRAIDLLGAALRTCDALGMSALRAKVSTALDQVGVAVPTAQSGVAAASAAAPLSRPSEPLPSATGSDQSLTDDGTFRLEGEYWTVSYDSRVVRLKDSKGMRVLARLLADPGRPHPSLDLERLGALNDEATARAVASGDAGELIDGEARRAYRARLLELREMVEEAGAWGKVDQVGKMREEMDFITHELGAALGLGGRSRVAGSIAERARLNITRAVKSAMQRIAVADAGLATHLGATVHTGTVCVYSPDPRSTMSWRVSLGDVHHT